MTDGVDYCKTCFHPKDFHKGSELQANVPCLEQGCECENYIHGETRVTSATGASKGTKEARYDLIPIPALDLLARLYGKGAVKYAAHNWRLGYEWSKSYAAAQRHMNAFWSGEDIDPETGIPHPICAAFHMFALTTYLTEHPELDDRFETRDRRSDGEVPEETMAQIAKTDLHEVIPISPSYDSENKVLTIPYVAGVEYCYSDTELVLHPGDYQLGKSAQVYARPIRGFHIPARVNNEWRFNLR